MKKCWKILVAVLAVLIAATAFYLIAPGFSKMGNVYIADYAVSEDGTEMTITVAVSTSIGYVRKVTEHQQQGGKLYLDCYGAFGGINGSWGAKHTHTIRIDADTGVIALYRSANCYEPVLIKDENGEWIPSSLIYGQTQEPSDADIIRGEGASLATEGTS